jgi:tyrosine-protein phosphatase YwqE
VAHPERHPVEDLIERLRRLVARGALIQATAAHFVDEPTGPEMLALPRAGLVHVLGSDAHSSRIGRPVRLSEALQALATVEPARAHLNWIGHAAPWAIVRGQDLCSPFAADPVAGRVRRPLRGADRV